MRCVLICVLLCVFSAVLPAAESDTSVLVRRIAAARTLDSLEFEKQLCKRQGRPLDVLEERCRMLRDSLDLYRAAASGATFSPIETSVVSQASADSSSVSSPRFFAGMIDGVLKFIPVGWHTRVVGMLHPRSPFDWFILLVSLVAAISGAVLLFGIVGWFRDRFRRQRLPRLAHRPQPSLLAASRPPGAPPVSRSTSAPASPPAAPASTAAALDLLQRLKQIPATEGSPSPSLKPVQQLRIPVSEAAVHGSESEEGLDALRQRMRGEPERGAPPSAPPSAPRERTELSVRERVLADHEQGDTPQDIARHLHLSVDQVMLILRVAGFSS